jgi:hypothetical protein
MRHFIRRIFLRRPVIEGRTVTCRLSVMSKRYRLKRPPLNRAICYRFTVTDDELAPILDLEYREWMSKITVIFRDRDARIEELRRESLTRANPKGALTLWRGPVRLEALRKAVEARTNLREEYAQREPQFLS